MPSTYEKQVIYLRRVAAVLDELKMSAGCVDCGFNAWPEALHFDHLDPATKRGQLGWVRDRSRLTTPRRLDAFLAHTSKYCVVRCANCHAHRTKTEGHYIKGDVEPADILSLF